MGEHTKRERTTRSKHSTDSRERDSRTTSRTESRSRTSDHRSGETRTRSADHDELIAGPAANPPTVPEGTALPAPGERARRKREWSIQRSLEGTDTTEGEVPGQVLDVIGSGGRPLEFGLQRTLEDRMDADFGNVRVHTGPKATQAAEAIDAKAFTCGNDIVFNAGEYDPQSADGQFLLAHELAHVKQQHGGAPLSMMPKPNGELEIDPDPGLERAADEAAKEALSGEESLTVNRLGTDVHVQRLEKGKMFSALALFESENQEEDVGSFQQSQNSRRFEFLLDAITTYKQGEQSLENVKSGAAAKENIENMIDVAGGAVTEDGEITDIDADEVGLNDEATTYLDIDFPDETELDQRKQNLEQALQEKLDQVALTDDQRTELESGIDTGLIDDLSVIAAFQLVSIISPRLALFGKLTKSLITNKWGTLDGDIVDRAAQLQDEIEGEISPEGFEHGGQDIEGVR
ncbi:DUF4157 domain-containing protein [Natrinema pallidum]|uniref:DUF4157 domain-containing protein n=1 Tax=Natrinema pallidum TaxID=69527 RepID=A0A4P9THN2_9EURY|nr:DUF4157 domain-containing protein [Natrinema pallidum]QCW03625.1 DUF4157 domain-containing protein [Natrinema pallidum]